MGFTGHNHTEISKQKLSEHWKRVGHPKGMLGKHHSEETKQKMSLARRKDNNSNWKGGITQIIRGIRWSSEYIHWKKAVLKRDNYTCQDCGSTEKIDVHHIQSILEYPGKIFTLSNGLSLCEDCHNRHTFWARLKKRGLICKKHV